MLAIETKNHRQAGGATVGFTQLKARWIASFPMWFVDLCLGCLFRSYSWSRILMFGNSGRAVSRCHGDNCIFELRRIANDSIKLAFRQTKHCRRLGSDYACRTWLTS